MGRGNFHSCWSIGGEIQPSQVKQKVKNKLKRKECRSGKRTAELGALSGTTALCSVPEGKDALLWGAMTFTWVFSCCYSSDQMQEDPGGVLGKKIGFRQTGSRERILSLDRGRVLTLPKGHLLAITWAVGSVSPIQHAHSGYRHSWDTFQHYWSREPSN